MEKTIFVDDKEIRFKASAATPLVYRQAFGRDLFTDLQSIYKAFETGEELSTDTLFIYEYLSFVMAMQAEGKEISTDTVKTDIETWLDQFSIFSIYKVFPQIMDMWRTNEKQTVKPKNQAALPSDH